MKEYTDTAPIELTFEEVGEILHASVHTANTLISKGASSLIIKSYIGIAKKLNDVLKSNGFNHYTDEFELFKEYI